MQDKNGWTALMVAALHNDVEVVETLVEAGADPEVSIEGGITAINIARERGDKEIIRLLEKYSE